MSKTENAIDITTDWQRDAIDRFVRDGARSRSEWVSNVGPDILAALQRFGITGEPVFDEMFDMVVVWADGVAFASQHDGVKIVRKCPRCGAREESYTITNWITLGGVLAGELWMGHWCTAAATSPVQALAQALDNFMQDYGYTKQM